MEKHAQLRTILQVLLPFVGFWGCDRLLAFLFARLQTPLADWVTALGAFLLSVLVFFVLYRRIDKTAVPHRDRYRCRLPMAWAHVAYGVFWLILLMLGVLVFFPVTGDVVTDPLPVRLLSAVLVHPIWEEILFRRLCLDRLLSLSEVREEIVTAGEAPAPVTATRAGMLFAVLTQALLFALVHTGSGGMLYGFAGGVVLGMLMLRTGRLWVPILCHMLINLRSVVYPVLPETVSYGIDAVLLGAGLLCGALFWIRRLRVELRRKV